MSNGFDGSASVPGCSWDHKFYAVTPDGKKKWEFATGEMVTAGPTIGPDGTIHFGSWTGRSTRSNRVRPVILQFSFWAVISCS